MASWKFVNPQDRSAQRRRQALLTKIDAWWQEFAAKTADLEALFGNRKKWDLAGWMQRNLQGIDDRLMWEFGPNHATGATRLVITPESQRALRPLIETIFERAPSLPGWEYLAYRPPESEEVARQMVEARIGVSLPKAVTVRASAGELNRIDVTFESPGFPRSDKEQAFHQTFVALESLLGEEVLDKWIGTINVERSKPGRHSLSLERLKNTVNALIVSSRDQMPRRPLHSEPMPEKWSGVELKPQPEDDYVAQSDLLVAVTPFPQILLASLHDTSFYSERFTRCAEHFAYLKIDSAEETGPMSPDDRGEIEDELESALRPAGVATVVGGGTGLRYSYIELALTDVARTAEIIRPILRNRKVSKRSWLLFCDCDWHDEWLAIWDDTPAPPRGDEE